MAGRLLPCSGCQRHVRAGDAKCPFCGVDLDAQAKTRSLSRNAKLSRAAVVFAAGAAIAACGGSTEPVGGQGLKDGGEEPVDSSFDSPNPGIMYGPAIIDSSVDTKNDADAASDAKEEEGSIAVLYGPSPIDSGK